VTRSTRGDLHANFVVTGVSDSVRLFDAASTVIDAAPAGMLPSDHAHADCPMAAERGLK